MKINLIQIPDVHELAAGAGVIGRRKARRSAASAMGGEDGPADVAVGRHGCQFPPTEKNRQVTLTHLNDTDSAADRKQHGDILNH